MFPQSSIQYPNIAYQSSNTSSLNWNKWWSIWLFWSSFPKTSSSIHFFWWSFLITWWRKRFSWWSFSITWTSFTIKWWYFPITWWSFWGSYKNILAMTCSVKGNKIWQLLKSYQILYQTLPKPGSRYIEPRR